MSLVRGQYEQKIEELLTQKQIEVELVLQQEEKIKVPPKYPQLKIYLFFKNDYEERMRELEKKLEASNKDRSQEEKFQQILSEAKVRIFLEISN